MQNGNHLTTVGTIAVGVGLGIAGGGMLLQVPAINAACVEALRSEEIRNIISDGVNRGCDLLISYLTSPVGQPV